MRKEQLTKPLQGQQQTHCIPRLVCDQQTRPLLVVLCFLSLFNVPHELKPAIMRVSLSQSVAEQARHCNFFLV